MSRIVSAPIGGGAPNIGKKLARLTHLVEVDDRDSILRVLCTRVKPWHILEDSSLYDEYPADCPHCLRAKKKIDASTTERSSRA